MRKLRSYLYSVAPQPVKVKRGLAMVDEAGEPIALWFTAPRRGGIRWAYGRKGAVASEGGRGKLRGRALSNSCGKNCRRGSMDTEAPSDHRTERAVRLTQGAKLREPTPAETSAVVHPFVYQDVLNSGS